MLYSIACTKILKEPEKVTCYKKSFDQSAAEKLKKTIANKESNEKEERQALAEKERASFRKHSSSIVFTRVLF